MPAQHPLRAPGWVSRVPAELCSGRLLIACFSPGGWLSDVSEALAQQEESSSVVTSTFLYCPPTHPQLISQPSLGISYRQPERKSSGGFSEQSGTLLRKGK